ncbi:unnamed protein product [Prorocentrum cordatum]|uniref:Uncharacterized protein n=1 Tax=Prorocentrum cordatum TaxID=2364126 RepID=A0ABN9U6R3_9DINO|nr:unnamed protein product [Polarella glacialis]
MLRDTFVAVFADGDDDEAALSLLSTRSQSACARPRLGASDLLAGGRFNIRSHAGSPFYCICIQFDTYVDVFPAKKKKKAKREEEKPDESPDEGPENDEDEDKAARREEKKKNQVVEEVQVFVGQRLAGWYFREHIFLCARGRDRLLPLLWHQGAGFGRFHPQVARREFRRRCRKQPSRR